jgi:hypothetical protein
VEYITTSYYAIHVPFYIQQTALQKVRASRFPDAPLNSNTTSTTTTNTNTTTIITTAVTTTPQLVMVQGLVVFIHTFSIQQLVLIPARGSKLSSMSDAETSVVIAQYYVHACQLSFCTCSSSTDALYIKTFKSVIKKAVITV